MEFDHCSYYAPCGEATCKECQMVLCVDPAKVSPIFKGLTIPPLASNGQSINYGDLVKVTNDGDLLVCGSGKSDVCAPLAAQKSNSFRRVCESKRKRRLRARGVYGPPQSRSGTLGCDDVPFADFPYVGAHKFREELLMKRNTFSAPKGAELANRLSQIEGLGPCACNLHDPNVLDGFHVFGSVPDDQIEKLGLAPAVRNCHCYGGDGTPFDSKVRRNIFGAFHPEETSSPGERSSSNPFEVLADDFSSECTLTEKLKGKAKKITKFLQKELGLSVVSPLPERIECGHLRSAIRSQFPSGLSMTDELSLKTAMKVERGCCKACKPRFDSLLSEWKEARFEPQEVDTDHLRRFRQALRRNVPLGWNRHKFPYIPNGHATLGNTRREGGNWNLGGFSKLCKPSLVFSSGKPRIVTLYASGNTEVLTPLHLSLYTELKRKGWLLVGPPTADRVLSLNGDGEFNSFDYKGATDNIKASYVSEAVDVLIEQASGLTDEEIQCLRVLAELRILDNGVERLATRGQPMGSVMSFPLLCLINKTVVDLAMDDILLSKKISFDVWRKHKLLINGDDLLVKEITPGSTQIYDGVRYHGSQVGLVVNEEKTGRSLWSAEINSTHFRKDPLGSIKEQKKTNVSALYMKPTVEDVLGFAKESTNSLSAFRSVVRANVGLLKKQRDKQLARLPYKYVAICRKDKKIRKALVAVPYNPRGCKDTNFFPVETKPDDYGLTREEEIALVESRRDLVRPFAIKAAGERKRVREVNKYKIVSFRSLLQRGTNVSEETILKVLADGWKEKKQKLLVEEDRLTTDPTWDDVDLSAFELAVYSAPNQIQGLVDAIRASVKKSNSSVRKPLVERLDCLDADIDGWESPPAGEQE